MHDCQETKARLVDLVFGEAADAERLRSEVLSCDDCAAEHRALAETLRAFDRAAEAARPAEDFWPGYHARLAHRLAAAETAAAQADDGPAAARRSPAAWLRRALTTRWHVPAPVAVAALLLIICLTPFALRPAASPAPDAPRTDVPAPSANDPAPVRTVEVPVIREKIVTRTIYVPRPARAQSRPARRDDARLSDGGRIAGARESEPARDALTGFRPADDVRLRVIKGSFANEK